MLTCKEVARLISSDDAVEGVLPDRLRVKLHLILCKHCRGYAAQLKAVGGAGRALSTEYVEEPEALDRLEEAILKAIDESGRSDHDGRTDL